jgi:hypothetical protein
LNSSVAELLIRQPAGEKERAEGLGRRAEQPDKRKKGLHQRKLAPGSAGCRIRYSGEI